MQRLLALMSIASLAGLPQVGGPPLPALPWHQSGLLRLETQRPPAQMQALLQQQGLPPDYVQALEADRAAGAAPAAVSGTPLESDLDEPPELGTPTQGQPVMAARKIEASEEADTNPTLDLFGFGGQPTQL